MNRYDIIMPIVISLIVFGVCFALTEILLSIPQVVQAIAEANMTGYTC